MSNEASKETTSKWRSLTERLIYGTSAGKLDWDDGPFEDSVITSIKDVVITLRRVDGDYWITLSDQFGNVVDMFSDMQIHPLSDDTSAFHAMDGLFKNVKRKINGADALLDLLLNELPKEPDEFPF
ncbi:MAG: hypothetical protein HC783_08915 [Rhodobacteraceae bacterium]|nr:hypothetical protein [Paracoccaceae bacterium]